MLREKAALQVIALECFTASAVFCFVLFCFFLFCFVLFCFAFGFLRFVLLFCVFVFVFVLFGCYLKVAAGHCRPFTITDIERTGIAMSSVACDLTHAMSVFE